MTNKIPSLYQHYTYNVKMVVGRYINTMVEKRAPIAESTIVSSEIIGTEMHTVMLDIDVPASLIPSSTPGHSHLYIDFPMSWRAYKKLMKAMMKAGILEEGFYVGSVKRGYSSLRLPWVKK